MSETYIGLRPCGCLAMAIVDNLEHRKDVAREVGKAIREGLNVQKVSTETVRTMPWKCKLHQSQKQLKLLKLVQEVSDDSN